MTQRHQFLVFTEFMWVILRSYVTTGKGKLVLIAIGVHNISKNLRAALELYASWMA